MARDTDRVECRTPTPQKKPTRIDRAKFEAVRAAILAAVPASGEGVPFADLPALVAANLGPDVLAELTY